jgi:VIT1/CCC1 family predicted Fe2+/Mn2+ transporter
MFVNLAIYFMLVASFFLLVLGTVRAKSESEIVRHVGLGNIGAAIYLLLLTCLVAYLNP